MSSAPGAGWTVTALVYHSISSAGSPRFCCASRTFARHLRWLRATRYPVLSMDAFLRWLSPVADSTPGPRARERGPEVARGAVAAGRRQHAVLLTFDDGYRDFAEAAHPLLAEQGMPATLFAVAASLGGRSDWPAAEPRGAALLSDGEIKALAGEGVTIGAHGWRHRPLADTEAEEVSRELDAARRLLERIVGCAVHTLAYPYGQDSAALRAAAQRAGYRAAFTTRFGKNDARGHPFALHRTEVRGDDGPLSFVLKVRYGCSPCQLLWQAARRRARREVPPWTT